MQFGTRASGVMRSIAMGIVKSDIRNVIQNGVPENILSWAQELGEGVDGMEKNATATILYVPSLLEAVVMYVKPKLKISMYLKTTGKNCKS